MKMTTTTLCCTSLIATFFLSACPGGPDIDPLLVTTLEDIDDGADQETSLREALVYASQNGGEVRFEEGLEGTCQLRASVELSGAGAVSVAGPGAETITVAGAGDHRLIDVEGLELTIDGLTFTNGAVLDGGSGGAIRAIDAKLTITNSAFTKNKQQYIIGNGGALALEGSSSLSVADTTFNENTTNDYGGAVYNEATGGMLFERVSFTKNGPSEAGEEVWGAAIYDTHGAFTIKGGTFDANIGERGALFVTADAGEITLEDVTFTNHSASYGGGIYIESLAETLDTVQVSVTDGVFQDNSASAGGGAIHTSYGIDLTLTGCSFERNSSKEGGGAISSTGSVQVTSSSFDSNTALSASDALVPSNGGAIAVGGLSNESRLVVEDTTFTNNRSDGEGGAVHVIFSDRISLTNATFTNNSSGDAGAALLSVVEGSAAVVDSTFSDNTAVDRGGALHFGGDATLTGTTVSGNTAEFGGGISTSAGARLTIGEGTSITGNTATHVKESPDELVGGGICNDDEVLGDRALVSGNSPDDLCAP